MIEGDDAVRRLRPGRAGVAALWRQPDLLDAIRLRRVSPSHHGILADHRYDHDSFQQAHHHRHQRPGPDQQDIKKARALPIETIDAATKHTVYDYDPVGNVTKLTDSILSAHASQKTVATKLEGCDELDWPIVRGLRVVAD